MRIDAGLDTGEMLLRAETEIGREETAVELSGRLAPLGADLLVETLAKLPEIRPQKQDHTQATYAPILKKEDGAIDWTQPAFAIHNRVRGLQPWPGAYTSFRGQSLHIWKSSAERASGGAPGTLQRTGRAVLVGCGQDTALELVEVQLEGRKRMSGEAFANGHRLTENEKLGDAPS